MENQTTYRFAVRAAQGEQREARDRADEILWSKERSRA